jgi:hypothetical protein
METLDLLIGLSNLLLAFQKTIVPYHLDLEKYFKSILKNYVSFGGLGMNLAMKTNCHACIHGLIHDARLQACPSCLLGLMYVYRVNVRS